MATAVKGLGIDPLDLTHGGGEIDLGCFHQLAEVAAHQAERTFSPLYPPHVVLYSLYKTAHRPSTVPLPPDKEHGAGNSIYA